MKKQSNGWARLAQASSALALLLASACSTTEAAPTGAPGCTDDPGTICTWAGTGEPGFNSDGLALTETMLYFPIDLTFTEDGTVYLLDWNNHRVRRVGPGGTPETVIGSDFLGDGPDDESDLTAPGAVGTEVLLNHPTQVIEMPDGGIMLFAWHNHKLRRFDPETGLVRVWCGGPVGFAGDGGNPLDARMNQPIAGALRPDGGLYVLDQRNQVIRSIDADFTTINTVVGTPQEAGFAGDGGPPLEAKLSFPKGSNPPPGGGIALADDGRLYIADALNHRIRRVDFEANVIDTIAGTGEAGFGGDGGPATEAKLSHPREVEFGPDGRLYVADEYNHRIRAIDLDTGVITTVAGNGEGGFSGDGGLAVDAGLYRPQGITFRDDYLYIADTFNHRYRRVTLPSAQ